MLRRYAIGLRLCGWRPGEAWRAVSEPLGEERKTAGKVDGFGLRKRCGRAMRRGGKSPRDELTERASVFLVDAGTTWRSVIFDVGTHRRRDGISRRRCVNDADDARQNCLPERGDEDPATNNSRNATTHCVVSS